MTPRQRIEAKRGIVRDERGKIVLSDEQKRARLDLFRQKRADSLQRALRCRQETRAMEEALGMENTEPNAETVEDLREQVQKLKEREAELVALLATYQQKKSLWRKLVDYVKGIFGNG